MSGGDWKDMFYAAERGDVDLVRYHIRNGIDPNYQHPEFLTTALVEAVKSNQLEVVKYLVDNGAKPSIKSEFEGVNAYQAAQLVNDPQMLDFFGLEPKLTKVSGWTRVKEWFQFWFA